MLERWRLAMRTWTQAVEAALGPEEAQLGRFRSAPPIAEPAPAGESPAWVEIRNALAGKVAAVGKLIQERGARGIPAWNVPVMPTLFGLSALVSGAGLYLVVAVSVRRVPSVPALAAVLMLLIGGVWMWVRYLTWSSEAAFAEAVAPLTRGREARLVAGAAQKRAPSTWIRVPPASKRIASIAFTPAPRGPPRWSCWPSSPWPRPRWPWPGS